MIVFDLTCDQGHSFEGWFGSSADFAAQQEGGLLVCPRCHSAHVIKAPMAPAVPRKGNQKSQGAPLAAKEGAAMAGAPEIAPPPAHGLPPEAALVLAGLARAQAKALAQSTFVGKDFADRARAMHYNEIDPAPIHGQASLGEARDLLEEAVPVMPLLFPLAPPDRVN